ncbi:MAG: hypothetical protein U1E52_07005 [Geminicoccaceae bacterium]
MPESSFPLADLPTTERAHNAVLGALVELLLTLPDLTPDLAERLRQLRAPGLGFAEVIRIAHELALACREHQARLGRP